MVKKILARTIHMQVLVGLTKQMYKQAGTRTMRVGVNCNYSG
jgi:hypothetical protein